MIRILISIPLLIVLVAFALSNQQLVRLGLWPTDILLDVPVSVAVLIGAAVFFILGAFMTWTGAVAARSRARRAERHVRDLRDQVESMRRAQVEQLKANQLAPGQTAPGPTLRGQTAPGQSVAMLPPG